MFNIKLLTVSIPISNVRVPAIPHPCCHLVLSVSCIFSHFSACIVISHCDFIVTGNGQGICFSQPTGYFNVLYWVGSVQSKFLLNIYLSWLLTIRILYIFCIQVFWIWISSLLVACLFIFFRLSLRVYFYTLLKFQFIKCFFFQGLCILHSF